MVRINMVVEGDTEEAFVKHVLAPYLSGIGVFPTARKVTTSRRHRVRGGMTSYGRAKNDIEPFFLLHEFEALLLSDPAELDETLTILQSESRLRDLEKILEECGAPENVNDDPQTAPSKRLIELYPSYDKVVFGELVAEKIGIDNIRKKCPHFDEWINNLKHLTSIS